MIIFKPLIENIKEYQRGNLSENAVRLNTPHSIDETLKKAAPITAVLSIVLFLAMFIKTIVEHDLVINPVAFIFGFIFGFLLLAVHELLHAVVYPKDAKVSPLRIGLKFFSFIRECRICTVRIREIFFKEFLGMQFPVCAVNIYFFCLKVFLNEHFHILLSPFQKLFGLYFFVDCGIMDLIG